MNAFGVYGVGVMGRGLALNIASKGHRVAIYNKEPERTWEVVRDAQRQNINCIQGFDTVRDFMYSLEKPKKVLMMVPAGRVVDDVIASMSPYIKPEDVIIDGGNEWYENTEKRQEMLRNRHGAHLVGMGVSGGAFGARNGASFMPGGDFDAVSSILKFLHDASDYQSQVAYIGGGGSGNYVKMVHNGIEYAVMQIIAEIYDVLRKVYKLDNETIQQFFRDANQYLDSYLLEITVQILGKKEENGDCLVDKIMDVARMNGTGTWTAKEAFEVLVPCPSIAAAANARLFSESREDRLFLSQYLKLSENTPFGPSYECGKEFTQQPIAAHMRNVLVTCMYMSYLQGFLLIQKKDINKEWGVNTCNVAKAWMGGCIIRSNILNFFANTSPNQYKHKAFHLLSGHFETVADFVSTCALSHVATPVISATYQYILGYTTSNCPANLTQAQRDYFGSHGYERIDLPGKHHTEWSS
jgi:6-phosphogluconate dehydrogenase